MSNNHDDPTLGYEDLLWPGDHSHPEGLYNACSTGTDLVTTGFGTDPRLSPELDWNCDGGLGCERLGQKALFSQDNGAGVSIAPYLPQNQYGGFSLNRLPECLTPGPPSSVYSDGPGTALGMGLSPEAWFNLSTPLSSPLDLSICTPLSPDFQPARYGHEIQSNSISASSTSSVNPRVPIAPAEAQKEAVRKGVRRKRKRVAEPR